MKELHWISLITWHTGHGEPLDDDTAERFAEIYNKEYKEIYHWTVAVFNTMK